MGDFFKGWRRKIGCVTLVIACVLLGGGFIAWREAVNYPYGRSHCCIKEIMFALELYADAHDGHYPTGKESPEASLSLLYYEGVGLDATPLRGKTVPEAVVQAIFDQKGFLGPNTCGWHYVDGLTQNDDRRVAILWDKAGLGHNGERNLNGGREVLLVGCNFDVIPHAEWPKFIKEQELLLANRDEAAVNGGPLLVGQIKLPSGELLDHWKGRYQLEKTVSPMGYKDVEAGDNLGLKWKRKDFHMDGEMKLLLALPDFGLRSKQVTINVENHNPSPRVVVFEMEEAK